MPVTAILDVDGTLVDTNYHHTLAWYRAFREQDITLPLWQIHRHIGMGGDQLVGALAGDDVEQKLGDEVRATEKDRYGELIDEVRPLPGARELIRRLKEEGNAVVLASSAKEDEVEHYLELLDARGLADGWTSSADVEATKPEPDLVHSALGRGDRHGRCGTGRRLRLRLRGGGTRRRAHDRGAYRWILRTGAARGGCEVVFESPATMLENINSTSLSSRTPPAPEFAARREG